jgi:hypothetical protein
MLDAGTKICKVKVKIFLLQAMEACRVVRVRQTANRWRQGCQPYAPAALYPQGSFYFF